MLAFEQVDEMVPIYNNIVIVFVDVDCIEEPIGIHFNCEVIVFLCKSVDIEWSLFNFDMK